MEKTLRILSLFAVWMLVSCQHEPFTTDKTDEFNVEQDAYVAGKAVIRVSDALALKLESEGSGSGIIPGAVLSRTFQDGGRYEERMRREGLHLWYNVQFDESLPLTKAGHDLICVEGVELVEYVPKAVINDAMPLFDDPEFKKQWHFQNTGNAVNGLVAGCDINVDPAWRRGVVGSDEVIVAVIDTGVDYAHEDLKDNMWTSVDAKGKTIYGYNAILGNNKINPQDHGTHVAGTIAAVNNNGIGVSGIAGGNAAEGIKGVRIMSCEIFEGEYQGNEAEAIVWAANHGAVIAQNSWGFIPENNLTETPRYVREAIDYFNTYAGCDEDGNQLPDSPMKGGVVIFATGNDAVTEAYPASYEGCISVSSVAGDYEMAYYSNHGDWVDIMAPGGDTKKNQMIISTIADSEYGRMQGTSMACPHVSGVAALIVSEFGGPGFTREQLIDRLLKTASDISLPADQMGHGLVDASAAVAHYGEFMPNVPEFANYEQLSATAFALKYIVPEENNGVNSKYVDLYWSETPFDKFTDGMNKITVPVGRKTAGDTLVFTLDKLAQNTTYYISVEGVDPFGYTSEMTENISISTSDNLPPAIEALDGTQHTYRQHEWAKLRFRITDPENSIADVTYMNATDGDTFSKEDDLYYLVIDAKKIAPGSYSSRIVVTDDHGKTAECSVSFVIEPNTDPVLKSVMEDIILSSDSASKTINLADYFTDADGESLKYTAVSSDDEVLKISVSKNNMTVTAASYGMVAVTVTASDAMGRTAKDSFRTLVRDGSKEFDLYPNPVVDGKLYVRSSDASEADLKIVSSSGALVYENKVVPDPFSPALEDVSALLPGVYSVQVTGKSGKVFTQNIVKL